MLVYVCVCVFVCVCVCVCERERERERVCMCVCVLSGVRAAGMRLVRVCMRERDSVYWLR